MLNIFLQHFIYFGSRARRPPRVSSFLRNFTNKSLAESWKNMFMLFIWEVISFRSRAVHMLSIIQITGGFAQSISTIAAGVSPPCGSSEQLVKQGARRGIPRDDTCTTSNREGVQICTLHYSSLQKRLSTQTSPPCLRSLRLQGLASTVAVYPAAMLGSLPQFPPHHYTPNDWALLCGTPGYWWMRGAK